MKSVIPSLALLFAPLAFALAWDAGSSDDPAATGIDAGRRVYVAEGCIHCHSQFLRPGMDEDRGWGVARGTDFVRHQNPVLIGNRRQGPDLVNVGLRRPREWQRLHLVSPELVSPGSLMPSYAHLFSADDPSPGEALLDYLDSLGRESPASDES